MVRTIQVRGYKEEVIFIENHGDNDKVIQLQINKNNLQETERFEVFTHF